MNIETFRTAPAFLTRDLSDAERIVQWAAATKSPAVMLSSSGAASIEGALWFWELTERAAAAEPSAQTLAVIDCGVEAGRALEALSLGFRAIVFTGKKDQAGRLSEMAERQGVVLYSRRPREEPLPEISLSSRTAKAGT